MPFTFAHPAIVLPLGKLGKRWFSLTGLVVGNMTPDFEYFIRMRVKSIYSHTIPGLFGFDLPLGLILVFIYQVLIKNKLIDHLPSFLHRRFFYLKNSTASLPLSSTYLFKVTLSVLIGAASHLLWDGFTHPAGYFVATIPMLKSVIKLGHYQLYTYKLLQHLSTLTGLTVIAIAIFSLHQDKQVPTGNFTQYWGQVILVIIITLAIRLLTGLDFSQYGNVAVTMIAGFWLGLISASALSIRKDTKISN